MSFSDRTRQLEQSFRTTSALLGQMLAGMKARRAAWTSARPSVLVPEPELERLAQQLAGEETTRSALVTEIRRMLPAPPGTDATTLHVNVTRIAAAMAPEAGRALRAAADEATRLAKEVRVETTLGQRLLQFTQRAQQGLLAQAGNDPRQRGPAVYDRHARTDRSARVRAASGVLVDGKI